MGPLPDIEPLPSPSPAPAPPPRAPHADAAPLDSTPRFVLRGYRVDGNTALDEASIKQVIAPYVDHPISIADLEEIRQRLTRLDIERGYINSGIVIPDQDVASGIVVFRAVEGRITEIKTTGTDRFNPDYFTARLERGLATPFNVNDLEREQQILLQDSLVRRLNLDIEPGLVPGEARLGADIAEASPYSLNFQIANNQSPTVGEVRGQVQGAVANLLGYGDSLAVQYGRSEGLNDGAISYSLPIASDDTRLNLRYDINGTLIVSPALSPLNITSHYDSYEIGLTRPFYRTPDATLTLGAALEKRDAQSFLLGSPFSFTAGSDNGKTNVTALRLSQDWIDRDADHALALRSTFSIGLHALGATDTGTAPSGKFFSWLGQAQYVRRVFWDWDLVARSDLQLANRGLFPIEQFALGGIDTVRGYREYLTVTDDAFFGSLEMRVPLGKFPMPWLPTAGEDAGILQLVPFYDYGRGWNVGRPTPYPP
ncbi:MAG TPA: ShlB/FhaC/HecB family hemolysin secretion/activation protein, partial [Stellaceae bacterium]|nr:ShlB/FhaC/HecB family hemolysin secretion/activation protein [Stellaceae bacterium]